LQQNVFFVTEMQFLTFTTCCRTLNFGIFTAWNNKLLVKCIFASRYFREIAKVTKFGK